MDKPKNFIPAHTTKDLTPERDAARDELQRYEEVRQAFDALDTSETFGRSNPGHLLYVATLDGAANDSNSPDSDALNAQCMASLVENRNACGVQGNEYLKIYLREKV